MYSRTSSALLRMDLTLIKANFARRSDELRAMNDQFPVPLDVSCIRFELLVKRSEEFNKFCFYHVQNDNKALPLFRVASNMNEHCLNVHANWCL